MNDCGVGGTDLVRGGGASTDTPERDCFHWWKLAGLGVNFSTVSM